MYEIEVAVSNYVTISVLTNDLPTTISISSVVKSQLKPHKNGNPNSKMAKKFEKYESIISSRTESNWPTNQQPYLISIFT